MICSSCRSALRLRLLATASRPSRTAIAPIANTFKTTTITNKVSPQHTRYLSSTTSRQFSSTPLRKYSSPSSNEQLEEQEADMSPAESSIAAILAEKLHPTSLLVQDISGGCGSMYAIDITSPVFKGLNMLKQQRMVNAALGDLVKEWHGVQIRTRVPPEEE
ncbi:Altered inheritance of mitochondria protein 1 [Trichoderma lentiforme]|uniref:Altered inheritance of mitochondria protein 1 n=1 Tax=Trichoderma lentiforme TaxID=1567552 RepID=A0A9P5CGX3_9HYPO|nr:Altered inheritance of mitochondria protein 1 [Trichoderma lentiforme]